MRVALVIAAVSAQILRHEDDLLHPGGGQIPALIDDVPGRLADQPSP